MLQLQLQRASTSPGSATVLPSFLRVVAHVHYHTMSLINHLPVKIAWQLCFCLESTGKGVLLWGGIKTMEVPLVSGSQNVDCGPLVVLEATADVPLCVCSQVEGWILCCLCQPDSISTSFEIEYESGKRVVTSYFQEVWLMDLDWNASVHKSIDKL